MRLAVSSICPHIFFEGHWWSYEPFVKEMDVWASLFDKLVMVCPVEQGPPPAMWSRYAKSDCLEVIAYRHDKGVGLEQGGTSIWEIPTMVSAIARAAKRSDAFHARCPGSIGLVSCIVVPFLQKRMCAKYAGQWNGYPGEVLTVRLQRWLLSSRWWRGPVTVYGNWPNQPANVVPFFTSIMTRQQMQRAELSSITGPVGDPLRVLYVGRLSESKNVHVLLSAVATLRSKGISLQCNIVGDGPQRAALERQARELGLSDAVLFAGGVDFEQALDFYEHNDILVLASETEGWPKAIAEAMAFGLICIGSNRGLVPEMLGEGRGLVVPPGDVDALTTALQTIAYAPQEYQEMRLQAAAWAQRFSLEDLREALRQLLEERWKVSLVGPPTVQATTTDKPESVVQS